MRSLVKKFNRIKTSKPYGYYPGSEPSISPSALGSPCARKIYYTYSKAPKEGSLTITQDRIFDFGTTVGDYLIESFRQGLAKKIDVQVIDYRNPDGTIPIRFKKPCVEFPVSSEALDIKMGLIDMVCIEDGVLRLAEFKGPKESSYAKTKSPVRANRFQAAVCLKLFNKNLAEGKYSHIQELEPFTAAEGIYLVYYCKNTSELKEFYLEDVDLTFREIVKVILAAKSVLTTHDLPGKTDDFCFNCNYKKRCDKNLLAPREGGTLKP